MSQSDTLDGYLTPAQAGQRLGVTAGQVARYVAAGQLPAIRSGRSIFIPAESLDGFTRPQRGNPQFRK